MPPQGIRLRIRLEPAGLELTLAPGERLVDAIDARISAGGDVRALLGALPTVCRAANCGMCLLRQEAGSQGAFSPPKPPETRLLARLGAADTARLGCQLHAAPEPNQAAPDPNQVEVESEAPLIVLRLAR